jgi:hypothetical protein
MERATSSRLIIAARAFLLVLGAGALILGLVAGRKIDGGHHAGGRFVCPMHPDVTGPEPGDCPICHMSLVERTSLLPGAPAAPDAHDTHVSALPPSEFVSTVGLHTFSRDLTAPARVDDDGSLIAHLYDDELGDLAPDQLGSYVSSSSRRAAVAVRPAGTTPVRWDGATVEVRFSFEENAAPRWPAGDVGWIKLAVKARAIPVVPAQSVLWSSSGPYVLVSSANGTRVEKRPIEIGRVLYGVAVVRSGLSEKERFIARNAFFLDAERRLSESLGRSP